MSQRIPCLGQYMIRPRRTGSHASSLGHALAAPAPRAARPRCGRPRPRRRASRRPPGPPASAPPPAPAQRRGHRFPNPKSPNAAGHQVRQRAPLRQLLRSEKGLGFPHPNPLMPLATRSASERPFASSCTARPPDSADAQCPGQRHNAAVLGALSSGTASFQF